MGFSSAENIAIQIETFAELSGIEKARGGLTSIGETVGNVNTQINTSIGAFEAFGKTIDVTNARALKSYREQGDALSSTLAGLGATEKELDRIGAAITRVERAAGATIISQNSPQAQQLQALPGKARTAANAVAMLSQAAVAGSGSMEGLAVAAGNVASGLSSVSNNARIAAGASAIGALVTIGAAAYGIYHSYTEQTRKLNEQLAQLASESRGLDAALAGDDLSQRLEAINRAADTAISQAKEIRFHEDQRNQVLAAIEQKREREIALAKQADALTRARETATLEQAAATSAEARFKAAAKLIELDRQDGNRHGVLGTDAAAAQRLVDLARAGDEAIVSARNRAGELIGQIQGQYESQRRAIEIGYSQELRSIDEMTLAEGQRAQLVDSINAARAYGLQLLDREVRMQRADLSIEKFGLSADPRDQQYAEELEIEKERLQRLRDFPQLEEDINRNAQLKIAQLRRRTIDEGIAGYGRLGDAVRHYGTFAENAAKSVADAVRKFEILVQARKDAIKAKSEWAAGLASLGAHDFWGATQHFAASAGFAAAAVAGGVEAASGSGGGGGAGAGSGAYSPSTQQQESGGQTTVINLITTDPYNRENINRVSWQLQRNGTLNVPIYPTNGLSMGAI